jgi:hypothetical protein
MWQVDGNHGEGTARASLGTMEELGSLGSDPWESDRACHGRWRVGMLRPRVAHRRLRGARCSEEGP